MLVYTREKLIEHLLQMKQLSVAYQEKDPAYVGKVIHWMDDLEDTLQRLRKRQCGLVASERAKLEAIKDGFRDPLLSGDGGSPRKLCRAYAAIALSRIEAELSGIVSGIDQQFESYRERLNQLVTVLAMRDQLDVQAADESLSSWSSRLWDGLVPSAETDGMVLFLSSSLKRIDLLHLFGETIENYFESRPS